MTSPILIKKCKRPPANTSKWPKQEAPGWEVVFKPCGPEGAGFYFIKTPVPLCDKPLAVRGLLSYRYNAHDGNPAWGWVMIGAKNTAEALSEATRSVSRQHSVSIDRLQIWNGEKYIPATL